MMINRYIYNEIHTALSEEKPKIIILYGPRQVGKTTLIQHVISELPFKTLSINADEQKYIDALSSRDLNILKSVVSGYDLLFLDEAQRVPDIGINLKILYDNLPNLKIIATGSSSFDLANKVKEPLTGRTKTLHLYPLSLLELSQHNNHFELNNQLEFYLRYGLYPDIYTTENAQEKEDKLIELSSSYLFKDVLELSNIRYANKLRKLLQLLALQIGSQVSIRELASSLDTAQETIVHYIDLLEKAFVVYRLSGFSRNLRKEVSKMDKIYFYDLGIRNAILEDFKPLALRNDRGSLFENFLITERLKRNEYKKDRARSFFWRLHTGAEIDYIEKKNALLSGYEIKSNSKVKNAPASWKGTYPNATFITVNYDNFISFLT